MFIVGTILGIQFMIASAEEKAKVKETLVPYIVGCIVIFGAFTIWSIVVNLGQDITSDSSPGDSSSLKLPYYKVTGSWPWCLDCNMELPEGQSLDQHRSLSNGHRVTIKTERYYCVWCDDEWDEGEMLQRSCNQCRSKPN